MESKRRTAKTIKDYTLEFYGEQITVPAGSVVNNSTACGNDDDYRFWVDWRDKVSYKFGSALAHDLHYRGINVPAEFCEKYPA